MKDNDAPEVRQSSQMVEDSSPSQSARKLSRRAGQLLLSLIDMPFRYVFGRDIFISYSRRDSRRYSPNLALALQKRMPKLSVYLDRWIAPASGKLPLSLRLQLRWSSVFVVVCTENAVGSSFVKDEVARFARLRRKVVPVDVDGVYSTVRDKRPWLEVSGADPEEESGAAVKRGEPSEHVIERILKSVEFTTQDRRLRRAVWGTLAFVVLTVGGTILYTYNTVRAAAAKAAEAEGRAIAANEKAGLAEVKAKDAGQREAAALEREAQAKQGEATARRGEADAAKARGLAEKLAHAAAARAETQRRVATEQAKRAEQEGAKASSRELLAEAQQARYEGYDRFIRPVALAVEAYQKYPSFEPDSLFRYGLTYLPRPISSMSAEGSINTLALSRDTRRVIAAVKGDKRSVRSWDSQTGKELNHPLEVSADGLWLSHYGQYLAFVPAGAPNVVKVLATRDGRKVSSLEHDGPVKEIYFSEDENYLLTGSDSTLQVLKLGEKGPTKMDLGGPSFLFLNGSISQNGKVVASVSRVQLDARQRSHYLTLWDGETGRRLLPPQLVPSCPPVPGIRVVECVEHSVLSRDGRYAAYANLQTILIFDLQNKDAPKELYFDSPIRAFDILSGEGTYRLAVLNDRG